MVRPDFRTLAHPDRLWGLRVGNVELVERSPRRQAFDLVRLFVACRVPITKWGPPGSRKNRTVEALGRETDINGTPFQVITLTPSTVDPTVLHGIMYPTKDADSGETVMRRSLPDVANQIIRYAESVYVRTDSEGTREVRVPLGEPGHVFGDEQDGAVTYEMQRRGGLTVLLGDELSTCTPAQQAPLLGMLTHGTYGDRDISDYVAFIMAANPPSTVSSANDLTEAVMNRGGHIAWYGEMDLFLEEWSAGFGLASLVPTQRTRWYVSELLGTAPDEVFRNKRWEPDELVPWDLLEHSERVVTELGKVLTLIEEVFAGAEDSLRHLYIEAATKALLGPTWADRIAGVCRLEQEQKHSMAMSVVGAVRVAGIRATTTVEQMEEALGHGLHVDSRGVLLRRDQVESTMREMVDLVWPDGAGFDLDVYYSAWCFAVTAPSSGDAMGLHSMLLELYGQAGRALSARLIKPGEAMPAFISAEVKSYLRQAITAAQQGRAPAGSMS